MTGRFVMVDQYDLSAAASSPRPSAMSRPSFARRLGNVDISWIKGDVGLDEPGGAIRTPGGTRVDHR